MPIGQLIVSLFIWALTAFVLYWIVRVGVRHGTLDAYRIDRRDRRLEELAAARRREQAARGAGESD
ncbi:hypothetical protein GCM10023339_60750 [Alloalcanivorax gelatiniphagus]